MPFVGGCGIFRGMKRETQILFKVQRGFWAAVLAVVTGVWPQPAAAAQLSADAAAQFEQYLRAMEGRENADIAARRNFLWIDALPEAQGRKAYESLREGKVLLQQDRECGGNGREEIHGGLIHDWSGIVFIPEISLEEALSKLQNYDRDAEFYPAQVMKSKLLASSGADFRVFLRIRQREIITVTFDTEYKIHYTKLDGAHVYSNSRSTRIAEVENAGTAREHADTPGEDRGFLWRLDSYWHFYQADGGVYVQCRAISLTRNIPTGLGWLVGSFIEELPAKSLRETLSETRAALIEQHTQQKGG